MPDHEIVRPFSTPQLRKPVGGRALVVCSGDPDQDHDDLPAAGLAAPLARMYAHGSGSVEKDPREPRLVHIAEFRSTG